MQRWAEALQAEGKFGEMEQLLHQIAFGEYLHQIAGGIPMNQGEVVRLQDLGLGWDALSGIPMQRSADTDGASQLSGRAHASG